MRARRRKKRDDQHNYLFVAGVVAIVAIVALVLNNTGSLGGAATSDTLCMDDDPGDDIYKAGIVTVNNKLYEDYCIGDSLIQQYCHTGRDVSQRRALECENGCSDGVCLRA